MKYFRYKHGEPTLNLYPLVCWHLGAPQCDLAFIKQHVERIEDDPQARWVYLGDGGECVLKESKGDVYTQRISPQEQLDAVVELLEPVSEKGLFGVAGNHDRRILKATGLDWTEALCTKLGVPYMGNAAMAEFILREDSGRTMAFHTFWHHGVDSSSVAGGKLNAAKRLEGLVEADAIFSAHSHMCLEGPPSYVAYITRGSIAYREVSNYICGCAYDSRVPGYAEEKGYPPILPAHLATTLSVGYEASRRYKARSCRIWRKET